jgi:SAM-dependent methyltransferase
MVTDAQWQAWGEQDPYFGVLTEERFRSEKLTAESLEAFFRSGRAHVQETLEACRRHCGEFSTRRSLDFGCGVGRLLIPLAELAEECVGVDIAPAMLAEARRNCERQRCSHVRLVRTLEELPADERFTFIHSHIVLQHLEPQRGLGLIRALLARLSSGGVAALHVTYAHTKHGANLGVRPWATRLNLMVRRPLTRLRRRLTRREPHMQMNVYDMNRVLFLAHEAGVREAGLRFTDHGGHLGVVLFLRRE